MATFKEAFKAARAAKGAGKTFTWNGKSYSTDMASDKKEATPKARPMTSSPKPKAKPMQSSPKPKRSPRETPPKVDSTAPKTLTNPKTTPPITTRTANSSTPAKKSSTLGSKIRDLLTKGYLPGSAADERAKKRAQRYKDMDQAQVDMRMQRAEDEEKRSAKRNKK